MHRFALIFLLLALCLPAAAQGPYLWEADSTFLFRDKTQVCGYLDNLKAHSIDLIWQQVELYQQGQVIYGKSNLSHVPQDPRYRQGDWAKEDYLDFILREAGSRGIRVMIKFHGSNGALWDQHPDWRQVNWKGEEVLWGGKLRNFCCNAPYWDNVFFKMVEEIARNYPGVAGFYVDSCQYLNFDPNCCFCRLCTERFKKETGLDAPRKSTAPENWSDPTVRLYARKRSEWVSQIGEKFYRTVRQIRPDAIVATNLNDYYSSASLGHMTRHAAAYVTHATPEPVETPRMHSVVYAKRNRDAGRKADEAELARDELLPGMTTYGYNEFMVKTLMADSGGKPVIPISRYWFVSGETMGSWEVEVAGIESGLAAGAKGYCFFGYLGTSYATGKLEGTLWENPRYIAYLAGIKKGLRGELIGQGRPAPEVGILYDRDADFWTGEYWQDFAQVGGLYALLQLKSKIPVGLVATSEPDEPGWGPSGYRLKDSMLAGYRVLLAPRLECVDERDLQILRRYVQRGGILVLLGPLGRWDKFGQPLKEDLAYQILGVSAIGEPAPAGSLEAAIPYGEKARSLECRSDYPATVWETVNGKRRPAVLEGALGKGRILYMNSSDVKDWNPQVASIAVATLRRLAGAPPVEVTGLPPSASANLFELPLQRGRYVHVFTLDPATDVTLRFRIPEGRKPTEAVSISSDGTERAVPFRLEGNTALIRLREIRPYYEMVLLRLAAK